MERPDLLIQIAEKHHARDTTQRQTALAELRATQPHRSQYVPGIEIPERNWAVRLAKWYAFNDFGAYTRHFKADNWRDPQAQTSASSSEHQSTASPEPVATK